MPIICGQKKMRLKLAGTKPALLYGVDHDGTLFSALRPEDRLRSNRTPTGISCNAIFNGNRHEKKWRIFGYGGVQSYPSRTKDVDDVDSSTGSVGLGVAMTSFEQLFRIL